MSKKPQHSNNTFISCYLQFLAKAFSFFLSRLPPARWIGPWAKEYTSSITWSLTTRLPRPLDGHFFAHCEAGFVALHTITWQCTNTNGLSAMNLKASKLNHWALDEGPEKYFTVTSFGNLRKRVTPWLDFNPYFTKYLLPTFYFPNVQEAEIKFIKD